MKASGAIDKDIEQSDMCHHHYVTDLFVDRSDQNRILQDYYHTDRVHLNSYGLALFKQLLDWVIESYYEGNFCKTRTFSTIDGPRTARWKF